MTELGAILWSVMLGFALLETYLYLVENKKRRDCHTDLSQLLHDEKITKADLRRTTDHDELQRYLE